MFQGFQLNTDSIPSLYTEGRYVADLKKQCKSIEQDLRSFYNSGKDLDGDKIKEAWFPKSEKYHVFISHSHSDLGLAEALANWLYDNFMIKSFIDSYVWGFANDLLRTIDDQYARHSDGSTYDYSTRNHTTSHVHMMLNNALANMIDSSECLLFINTENAISKAAVVGDVDVDCTYSPWIMSELQISRLVEKKEDTDACRRKMLNESASTESFDDVRITHKVDLSHLKILDIEDLESWKAACYSGNEKEYDALTYLYKKFGDYRASNFVL